MSCTGCIHNKRISIGGGGKCCHYALDTNECRLVPVEGCPFYINEEEVNTLAKKINDDRANELYKNGATDAEIAKEFGVTSGAAAYWRYSRGLRANPRKAMNLSPKMSTNQVKQRTPKESPPTAKGDTGLINVERMNQNAESRRTEPEVSAKTPATAADSTLDLLIYDAFDHAISVLYEGDHQPRMIWRELLAEVEKNCEPLCGYITAGTEVYMAAAHLAALAAIDVIQNRRPIQGEPPT